MTSDDAKPPEPSRTDDEWIDELGKRAGGAVRRPAPEGGFSQLQQRHRARRAKIAAGTGGAAVLILGIVGFAVTRDSTKEDQGLGGRPTTVPTTVVGSVSSATDASATTTVQATTPAVAATTTTATPATTSPPTSTEPAASPDVAWAAQYLSAEPGRATGDPFKIGWMHNATDTAGQAGMERSLAYLNAKVGGIRGRPVELVVCDSAGDNGSQRCAAELAANDDLEAVITTDVSTDDVYSVISNDKALMVTWHGTPFLLSSELAIFLADGTAGLSSMLSLVGNELTEAREVVLVNNIGFTNDTGAFLDGFAAVYPDVTMNFVNVDSNSTADQVAEAIRAVVPDIGSVDVISTYGFGGPWCEQLPAARRILESRAELVLMDVCVLSGAARELAASSAGAKDLEGSFMFGYVHPVNPSELGLHVLETILGENRSAGPFFDNAWNAFGTLFTFAKIVNEMDPALDLTAVELKSAIRRFDGAAITQFGPMSCGRIDPGPMPASGPAGCTQYAGVFRFVGGEWTVIADGRNGKLLDFTGIVDVDPNLFPAAG